MNIRLLMQSDWENWKNSRLRALQKEPSAFGASYEEVVRHQTNDWQESLKKNSIFGAFIEERIIGTIGFYALNNLKTKHRVFLFGVYVHPEHQNIERKVLQAS
ncbi:MAG: GNAT family N-acetyltransferase [Janthinobacterium lividum]